MLGRAVLIYLVNYIHIRIHSNHSHPHSLRRRLFLLYLPLLNTQLILLLLFYILQAPYIFALLSLRSVSGLFAQLHIHRYPLHFRVLNSKSIR